MGGISERSCLEGGMAFALECGSRRRNQKATISIKPQSQKSFFWPQILPHILGNNCLFRGIYAPRRKVMMPTVLSGTAIDISINIPLKEQTNIWIFVGSDGERNEKGADGSFQMSLSGATPHNQRKGIGREEYNKSRSICFWRSGKMHF